MTTFTQTDLNFQSRLFYTKIFLALYLLSIIVYIVFVTKVIVYESRQRNTFITCFVTAFACCISLFLCFSVSSNSGQIDPVTNTEILVDVSNFSTSINSIMCLQFLSLMIVLFQLLQEFKNPTTQVDNHKAAKNMKVIADTVENIQNENLNIASKNYQELQDQLHKHQIQN
jgi:magnesium-transporting ATPase (P-type)